MFEDFPYTNFHDLNLDWLLNKIMEAYSPENPPPVGLVLSVNGDTGAVVLYKEAIITLPAIPENAWNIHRIADGASSGIQFIKGQPMQRIDGVNRYNVYDEGNPPPTYISVTSVNGQNGIVNLTGEDIFTDVGELNTIAQDINYLKNRTMSHSAVKKVNSDGVMNVQQLLNQFKTDLDNMDREDALFSIMTFKNEVYQMSNFDQNQGYYMFTNINLNFGSNMTMMKQIIISSNSEFLQINSDGNRYSETSSVIPIGTQIGLWI